MEKLHRVIATLGLLAFGPVVAAVAQERTYLERLGSDTTSIEVFNRTAKDLRGRIVTRVPVTQIIEYHGVLAPDGAFERFTASWTTPETNPGGPPSMRAIYTFGGDSITVQVEQREQVRTTKVATSGGMVIPFLLKLPVVYGLFDHVARLRSDRGVVRLPFQTLAPGSARVAPNEVWLRDDGRLAMLDFGLPVLAEVGPDGSLGAVDATPSTHKTMASLVPSVEFDALARRFAALDARGEGLGPASTRDTVRASIAGAELTIDYGRPAMRGRRVWGDVVEFGEVWRTGADAATQFTTSKALLIGQERLAAGKYSLWTVPTERGMTLIVNAQSGQWGTQYDPNRDVFRVPMDRVLLNLPVERLTLGIAPTEEGARLTIAWGQFHFSVPLLVDQSSDP